MKQTKKIAAALVSALFAIPAFAQLQDEKNVTITMDLQPILQLNMTTADQVNFVFDDIGSYYGGIIKYGATTLKVSSSVTWDLYAVGTSTNGTSWDQQVKYGAAANPNAISSLPLSALELHQRGANNYDANATGAQTDYSAQFSPAQTAAVGVNSIYVNANPYIAPTAADKYIQGHKGTVAAQDGAPGGSYLTATTSAGSGNISDYMFIIDYRILPGLPAVFPNAGDNAGTSQSLTAGQYAQPGVYSMNVKYVLLEDQ